MELSRLEEIDGQVSEHERRLIAVEESIQTMRDAPLPAWVGLREACRAAGLSYESIRRPENRELQPGRGEADAYIRARRMWKRETIRIWIESLGEAPNSPNPK